MTFERKIVVGFDDIRAVIFECTDPQCRARTVVSPDSLHEVPRSCSSCNAPWRTNELATHVTTSAGVPLALVQAIRTLRILLAQPNQAFRILLEFDEPATH
jgi:hypothetical protein